MPRLVLRFEAARNTPWNSGVVVLTIKPPGTGPSDPTGGYRFWDIFDIYFLDGKVVGAHALRAYGDVRDAPGGVRPGPVFWVKRRPDGTEERGVGPLFKDVFGCDPPSTIPQAP